MIHVLCKTWILIVDIRDVDGNYHGVRIFWGIIFVSSYYTDKYFTIGLLFSIKAVGRTLKSNITIIVNFKVIWKQTFESYHKYHQYKENANDEMFIFDKNFCVVLLGVFTFWVPCCDLCYDFRIKTIFGLSLPLVVCRRVHVLFTFLCVYLCIVHVVSKTLCWVFILFFFVLCTLYCQFLRIVPSVFSNICLSNTAKLQI